MGTIREIYFPLPPFKEQKRIVQKVDELMALCDAPETQIEQSKTHSEQLSSRFCRKLSTPSLSKV